MVERWKNESKWLSDGRRRSQSSRAMEKEGVKLKATPHLICPITLTQRWSGMQCEKKKISHQVQIGAINRPIFLFYLPKLDGNASCTLHSAGLLPFP